MKRGELAYGEQQIEITRTRVAGQVVGRAVNKRDRTLNNRTGGHFGATSLQSVEASGATEAAVALRAYLILWDRKHSVHYGLGLPTRLLTDGSDGTRRAASRPMENPVVKDRDHTSRYGEEGRRGGDMDIGE